MSTTDSSPKHVPLVQVTDDLSLTQTVPENTDMDAQALLRLKLHTALPLLANFYFLIGSSSFLFVSYVRVKDSMHFDVVDQFDFFHVAGMFCAYIGAFAFTLAGITTGVWSDFGDLSTDSRILGRNDHVRGGGERQRVNLNSISYRGAE